MASDFKKVRISKITPAGDDHQVVSIEGGGAGYRKKPCSDCPWRKDAVGVFPAEAFVHSATTAYDMAENQFGCHQSGPKKPATCAGFLLRGSDHNLAVRLAMLTGRVKNDVDDGGVDLHQNYRQMAIANGVDPKDPALKRCRD
jgi:hypothetical protein